jgi:hypothetical protein
VANCHLSKILMDGGSSAHILYLSTLKKLMEPQGGYKEGMLGPSLYPLTGSVLSNPSSHLGKSSYS